MIKTILSIDLDFILSPSIQLYNDLVVKEPYYKLWEMIEYSRNVENFLLYDENKLKFIYDILKKVKNHKTYFGETHENILFMIEENITTKDKIDLYNIDHHHDINFNVTQEDLAYNWDVVDCGSWITFLQKNKIINNYFWINNKNSKPYLGKTECCPLIQTICYDEEPNFRLPNFDMIYITSSQQWFPPKFLYIIEDLKKFLNQKFEVIDYGWREFNENNQSRKLMLK